MSTVGLHNPDCGTSRNALAIIRSSSEKPVVIECLQINGTRPQRLGLRGKPVSDDALLDAMSAYPLPSGPLTKEDGQMTLNKLGDRLD